MATTVKIAPCSERWSVLALTFICLFISFQPAEAQAGGDCFDPLSPGFSGQTKAEPATHECLGCICEASSHFCDPNQGCIHGGSLCGPFLISKGFWLDAGKCTLNGQNGGGPSAFEDCANDIKCASKTLRSYYNNFAQDCNGDGTVSCDDYAMIHRNGAYSCSNDIFNTDFWRVFSRCKEAVLGQGRNL